MPNLSTCFSPPTPSIRTKAFSLVELMIALAIIALLSSFAIPAYQDHSIRARVASGLVVALSLKEAVLNNAANGRPFNEGVSLQPPPNSFIKKLEIAQDTGTIRVTYLEKLTPTNTPYTLTLVPKYGAIGSEELLAGTATSSTIPGGSRIVWSCRSAEVLQLYGGWSQLAGTLPAKWAPSSCNQKPW